MERRAIFDDLNWVCSEAWTCWSGRRKRFWEVNLTEDHRWRKLSRTMVRSMSRRGTTVGYLQQEILGESGRTVLEEAMTAFVELQKLEARCREVEAQLEGIREDRPDLPVGHGGLCRVAW